MQLSRWFTAAPATVFDAWIDPQTASQWLFNTKTSKTVCELDPRPGGKYRITRTRGGKRYVAVGEYRVVERPDRIVLTFEMPQFAADTDTVTVELGPDRGGCLLSLRQEGLRPGYEKSTLAGWEKMFVRLDKALG